MPLITALPLSAIEAIVAVVVVIDELLGFLFMPGRLTTGVSLLCAHLGRLGGRAHKVGREGM